VCHTSTYVPKNLKRRATLFILTTHEQKLCYLFQPPNTTLKDYGRLQKDGELKVKNHVDNKTRVRYVCTGVTHFRDSHFATKNLNKVQYKNKNKINPATFLCLSQARNWISNVICYVFFGFNCLRLELNVDLVDIGGIVDHHYWSLSQKEFFV
jgi:hypothetical protein